MSDRPNILYVTTSDPVCETCGNEQRTAALFRALEEIGTVYTLIPVKRANREFSDAGRRIQGRCLLPPRAFVKCLMRSIIRDLAKSLPAPLVDRRACARVFPGIRFDCVVVRYLPCAVATRAWGFGPCFVDIDDFPDELYETTEARRHGPLRRAFWRWAIRRWMLWAAGHLAGAWLTNAQRMGALPGLPMTALPNIARPVGAGFAFDAPRRPVLLTVGLMSYPPNHEGVDRFLSEIWPAVREAFPQLSYRIIGRGVPEALRQRWAAFPNVEVAGFVEDLEAEYVSALACVAPVDSGGGTCIKTIEAILHGRSCLATPFAARGWPADTLDGSLGLHVYRSASEFVEKLAPLVRDTARRARQETAGRLYAERHFGFARFGERVRAALGYAVPSEKGSAVTVSVILPMFRVKDYLPEAIASLKAQTFTDWECLCLDDGSGNGMADLARALTRDDPRFLVREFPNAGVAATRNRGLSLARGRFVAFLDQDDAYHPDYLGALVDAIQRTSADCAMCRYQTSPFPPGPSPRGDVRVVTRPCDWLLETGMTITVWTKLWRRDALGDVRFDTTLYGSDDALFTYSAFARFRKVVLLDVPLYFYRRHEGAVSVRMPSRYVFACLRFNQRWPKVLPKPLPRAFRKAMLKTLSDHVKVVYQSDYPLATRRAIARRVLALLRANGLTVWDWSWGKRVRWWALCRKCGWPPVMMVGKAKGAYHGHAG